MVHRPQRQPTVAPTTKSPVGSVAGGLVASLGADRAPTSTAMGRLQHIPDLQEGLSRRSNALQNKSFRSRGGVRRKALAFAMGKRYFLPPSLAV